MKFPNWLVNSLKRPFCPTPTPPLPIAPLKEPPPFGEPFEFQGSMAELMEQASSKSRKPPKAKKTAKRTKPSVSTKKNPLRRSPASRKG